MYIVLKSIYILCCIRDIMTADYFHLLDADVWTKLPVRNIGTNGYVYVGRKYHEEYEAKVFVKKEIQA
jgi:hypothetical protein